MSCRSGILALVALAALLGGGCGDGGRSVGIETDDVVYQEGKQLQRQGRNPEALTAFLKVIERRGEQYAPESHFEAGLIYLQHIKDPVEAIHHFRKYLELQPKSREAPYVRGLVESAKREFARTLPGRVFEDQSQWLNLRDQLESLQRENDQLKAELAARSGAPPPLLRVTRTPARPAPPAAAAENSPIVVAPVSPPATRAPSLLTLPPAAAAPAEATGRKHTVAPGETLFSISRKYGVKIEDIADANRDALPTVNTTLRIGTELRIP